MKINIRIWRKNKKATAVIEPHHFIIEKREEKKEFQRNSQSKDKETCGGVLLSQNVREN